MKQILLFFFGLYEKIIQLFLQPVFYKEDKFSYFKRKNERPVEYAFAFKCIAEIYPDKILDVGTGASAFTHLVDNCGIKVKAIDKVSGYWKIGMSNRHVKIIHDDITKSRLVEKFDLITCISVLEHIPNHNEAIKGMFSLLKSGGYVILTFPYNENFYHPDVYRDPKAEYGIDHKFIGQIFSRQELKVWLKDNNAEIVKQEYYEAFTGELWTMGSAIYPLQLTTLNDKHHLTCILLKKI